MKLSSLWLAIILFFSLTVFAQESDVPFDTFKAYLSATYASDEYARSAAKELAAQFAASAPYKELVWDSEAHEELNRSRQYLLLAQIESFTDHINRTLGDQIDGDPKMQRNLFFLTQELTSTLEKNARTAVYLRRMEQNSNIAIGFFIAGIFSIFALHHHSESHDLIGLVIPPFVGALVKVLLEKLRPPPSKNLERKFEESEFKALATLNSIRNRWCASQLDGVKPSM